MELPYTKMAMKLKVLQQDFSKDLSIASRFASPKAQLPVLGNILLRAKKNKLLIGATNLETSILISTGAQVEETGELTVPARTLTDIVSNLPKEHIDLESKEEKLKVSSPGHSLDVAGMLATDFPDIPQSVGDDSLEISTTTFVDSLSSVLFATSHDETRPVLTGVLVTIDEEGMLLVATDGFRLSRKKLEGKFGKKKLQVIVPKSVLSELTRLVDDRETIDFSVSEKESLCIFGVGDSVLSSRLIQGDFPNYNKIIPTNSDVTISVDKEELKRGVKIASVFARDSANVVTFHVSKAGFSLKSQSDTSGEQQGVIDAKVDGDIKDEIVIGFNYKFVEDFLGSAIGDNVEMKFTDEDSAGVFLDVKQPDYLHLIMPVKL